MCKQCKTKSLICHSGSLFDKPAIQITQLIYDLHWNFFFISSIISCLKMKLAPQFSAKQNIIKLSNVLYDLVSTDGNPCFVKENGRPVQ